MVPINRKCAICDRHYNYIEKIINCDHEDCEKWIHFKCRKSRYSSVNSKWLCVIHKASKSELNNSNSDQSYISIISDSNMEKNEENDSILMCVKCLLEINDAEFKECKLCDKVKHDNCLSVNEIKSYDEDDKKNICDACLFFLANESLKKINQKKSIIKNEQDSSESDEDESDSENKSSSDDSDNENSTQNVTQRKLIKNTRVNTNDYLHKLSLKRLPIVNDDNLSWSVFYEAFKETKHLFSHNENITRIQDAILDEKVKKIGGKTLFNPKTYEICIKSINKRLKHNLKPLYKEASELEFHVAIKSHQKAKIIEFIDKLRNFESLAQAYEEHSYSNNQKFLANVINVLPTFLKVAWEKKQAKLEMKRKKVTLKKVIDTLTEFIPILELSIRNESFTNQSTNTRKEKDDRRRFEKPRLYHFESNRFKENNTNTKCWFHKINNHPFNKCKSLWSMDGKAVTEIAKKNGICTYCGKEWLTHKNCPNNKLKCNIEGCSLPHHSIFCFKRKANNETNRSGNQRNEQNVNNNVQNQHRREPERLQNTMRQSNTVQQPVDEMEEIVQQLNNSHMYTNNFSVPPSTSSDTRFNRPFRNNINIVDNSNIPNSCNNNSTTSRSILSVIVVKLNNDKQVALLIDSGSTVSLLEESIADELEIKGPWLPIVLYWSGGQKRYDNYSRVIKTEACGLNSNKAYNLYFRTVRDLLISPQRFVAHEFYEKYPHLLPLNLHDYEEISGVIGIDNVFVFEQLKMYKPKGKNITAPFGVRCPLGDYLFGSSFNLAEIYNQLNKDIKVVRNDGRYLTHNHELEETELKELEEMQKEIMGLDYMHPKENNDRKIAEEVYVLDLLSNETKKLPNSNHYVAPLLWIKQPFSLDTFNSFKVAMRRFLIVEKQAYKLGVFQECLDQVKNLLLKGYACELTDTEIRTKTDKSYYNPVFFIHPHNKRPRMIWDLAAKVNGKSLNDFLLAGPNMYNNLLEIVFQMRERLILFKGDLSEMFHQIFVNKEDSDALRFLFRMNPDEKVRVFKMLVLPFGAKCSPVISQYVKNYTALQFKHDMPHASEAILNNSYVDDIVKSVDTIEEAQSLAIQMKRILNTGGFNLLKINSNSQQTLDEIQQKLTKEELSHEKLFSPEKCEKLLGYDIDFRNDTLAISLNLEKFPPEIIWGHDRPNKRQVLQILMTLFDPIGFVQFVTSKMKILYHKLCQENYDWDQVLNDEHFSLWQKCLEWFKDIRKINIPRIYCPHYSNASEIQLWAFGDSGKDIACGVIFFRFMNQQNEQIGYNLVLSKSFVTPIKQQRTIPELELNVALKICIMANDVVKMHTFKIDKFVYATDNAAVKEWITNEPKKPSIYVKNRVDKIHNFTEKESWIWLPNTFMVADYGTKISSIPDICFQNDWFQPRLFSMPEKNWPEFTANKFELESQLNIHYLYAQNCEEDECNDDDVFDPSKFNKYLPLINAYQYAFRFIHLARNERVMKRIVTLKMTLLNDRHNRSLKEEIKSLTNVYYERRKEIMNINFMYKQSENLCFGKAQKSEFAKELKILKSKKAIPTHNRIHKLSPFLDQNDIIRVTTRLALTQENVQEYGYDRICPILLPKQHPLTSLIILKYHENNKHSLKSTVIANITQKFYIPHIKWTVNQTIKTKCLNCRIKDIKPQVPLMGELPAVRLAHHQPAFTNSIVDLAGPLTVNIYRNITDKRYIFVYSCLTTRAVHLELIERMDADSTLIALTNTINLRGAPKIIISDNGLNFKGAKTALDSDENKWNKVLLEKGVITTPINWKFGPPRTPHAQGSVERMVGLTKTILKKIIDMSALHKKLFNDFTLRAILCEVIGILNNRPLTLVPIQGTNTEILTPNYFLIGRQSIQIIPCTVSNKKSYSESYDDLKVISNILWNHWIKYYLPTILMREKWVDAKEPLKVGDIVMTVDTIVVNSWRIGKIIEVIIGSNNQARQYKVLLGKNNLISDIKNMSHKKLLEKYKNEKYSILIRGAQSIAKINLNAIKM